MGSAKAEGLGLLQIATDSSSVSPKSYVADSGGMLPQSVVKVAMQYILIASNLSSLPGLHSRGPQYILHQTEQIILDVLILTDCSIFSAFVHAISSSRRAGRIIQCLSL